MSDQPDKEALLQALGEFLMNEVRPRIDDPRLSFRLLIAANLTQIVTRELGVEESRESAELGRLRALLPTFSTGETDSTHARRQALAELNRALADELRRGGLEATRLGAIRSHLQETLRDKLRVDNPLFDLATEVD